MGLESEERRNFLEERNTLIFNVLVIRGILCEDKKRENQYLCSMEALVLIVILAVGLWLHHVTRRNGQP